MVDPDGTTSYYRQPRQPGAGRLPAARRWTAYDPMGSTSATSSVHGTTSYGYNEGDRLLEISPILEVERQLDWDSNALLTGEGSAVYTFDDLDHRLTGRGRGDHRPVHNGDGVRLGRPSARPGYLQDLAAPLPMVLSETTAGQTDRYVYGATCLTQVGDAGVPAYYVDGLRQHRPQRSSRTAGQHLWL
ncbi:MAG: hypothetical protein M9927_07785 [Anaerolineae bacterium]|nr:hypothetical protein [Anaerolineae bacterium]